MSLRTDFYTPKIDGGQYYIL